MLPCLVLHSSQSILRSRRFFQIIILNILLYLMHTLGNPFSMKHSVGRDWFLLYIWMLVDYTSTAVGCFLQCTNSFLLWNNLIFLENAIPNGGNYGSHKGISGHHQLLMMGCLPLACMHALNLSQEIHFHCWKALSGIKQVRWVSDRRWIVCICVMRWTPNDDKCLTITRTNEWVLVSS